HARARGHRHRRAACRRVPAVEEAGRWGRERAEAFARGGRGERARRAHPGALRADARRGRRAAVRARGTPARRDLRPQEGAAADDRGHSLSLARARSAWRMLSDVEGSSPRGGVVITARATTGPVPPVVARTRRRARPPEPEP